MDKLLLNFQAHRREILDRLKAVVRTYGLSIEGEGLYADEYEICGAEWCFNLDDDLTAEVTMYSGSYSHVDPGLNEHYMGVFATLEEAARYVVWLLKREEFYQESDEESLERLPCWKGTPGCWKKDFEHDDCEGY